MSTIVIGRLGLMGLMLLQGYEDCKALVADSDWPTLYKADQLSQQRAAGKVFYKFEEGQIGAEIVQILV